MSATLECPNCGRVTKDNGSEVWADVLNSAQVEQLVCGADYSEVRDCRRWFECECRKAVWIEVDEKCDQLREGDRGGGRWYLANDATAQLGAIHEIASEMSFLLERFNWFEMRAFIEAPENVKKYGWAPRKASELREALSTLNEAAKEK